MSKTYRPILLLSGALLMAVAPARIEAQSFDTSGTAGVSGQYLFRYVTFFNDSNGNITESCSLTGAMTFNGKGNYTISSSAQLFDSAGAGTGSCTPLGGGTYGVQSNGMAQLDNPMFPATLFGSFTAPVIMASSTEDDIMDTFIAVRAPSASASNSLLSGSFSVGMMDFLDASFSEARDGFFTMNADGNGHIAAFTLTGSAANLSGTQGGLSVGASTYSLSGSAGGTLTFPGTSEDQSQIVSGARVLYVSADGNYLVAGSTTGSDLIFGFRAPSGTSSNSLLNGTYFMAGMDANAAGNPPLDSFYGAINTNGDGNLIWHERFDDIVDNIGYDDTFNSTVTIGSNGYYLDTVYGYNYLVGANGNAVMLIGSGSQFSLNIGIHAPTITPTSSVWIYPVNITNAANYTPITNAFAPGELVDLYGNFGVATNVDSALPIPTELSGVQVFVNGTAAPVYLVSANQISALVPYEVSGNYFATFQVEVNGSKSNSVTVYVDNSSPGIYTLAQNGQGSSAILHADYSEVTDSSPAVPGETVLLFMNGLGNVTPTVADGAVGPSSPLSYSDEELTTGCPSLTLTPAIPCIIVTLYDSAGDAAAGTVQFAGLAPCCVGLYQVNFTLPSSGLVSGDAYIGFETLEGLTDLSTIALSSGFTGTAVPAATRTNPKLRHHPASYRKRTTNHRRALPDRVLER